MRPIKNILEGLIIVSLMLVAFQAYGTHVGSAASSRYVGPGPNGDTNYPNPLNQNVTLTGTMTALSVAPVCSLSNPPCAISNHPLYYINVNGLNYRLIFSNSTKLPLNSAHISVTGVYVTPSTYEATQWTPAMYFRGDIYVTSYVYIFPY